MISRGIIKNILDKISLRIPEYNESLKLLEEIKSEIIDACYSVLTEEEGEFMKKYEYYVTEQGEIDLSGQQLITLDGNKDFPHVESIDFENWSEYCKFAYAELDTPKEGYTKIPFLFKTWGRLKNQYPDLYEKWKEKLRVMLSKRREYLEKINTINNVLSLKNITITDLKKYYPEIYKIYKEND